MTEQELRALVREAIARQITGPGGVAEATRAPATSWRSHQSHAMFMIPAGADTDGPCLIEPAVACNHCGYCKSYGH